MRLRRARPEDSAAIAALHARELPDALLTGLGEAFVRAFYRHLISSPVAFAFVAEHEGRVVGFATAVVHWRRFYRDFLRRRTWVAVRAALVSLRGGRWRRLIETSSYAAAGDLPTAELVSIAVDRSVRGTGLGKKLTSEILAEFRLRGVSRVRVTAGETNAPATRLYLGTGFQMLSRLEMHPGEMANVFVISLEGTAPGHPSDGRPNPMNGQERHARREASREAR